MKILCQLLVAGIVPDNAEKRDEGKQSDHFRFMFNTNVLPVMIKSASW